VLVANGSDKTYLRHASEHLGSNIGAIRMVAEIFREYFFVSVRSREARLLSLLEEWEIPDQNTDG